jgi:RNA polymerase sigma-70 factor (ECF subfamily)
MDDTEDVKLVRQTLSGNTESYAVLVKTYEAPLLRYITYLVHDPDLAEDVVQDTFIKTYRNLAGFKQSYKFSSWLYRIAHNTAMDAVKKHSAVILEAPQLDRLTAVESSIAERIDQEILAKDLGRCLNKLPAKYRAPILLFYFQQKSYRDISDILRIPTATVGVRIGRAKVRMRELCKELEVQP